MAVINGTAYWSHIVEPNNGGKFPSGKYEMIIGNLSKEDIGKLKDLGMSKRIQNKGDEKETFIKVKSQNQPKVIDTDKKDIDPIPLIGNGSKVKVQVNTYEAGAAGLQITFNIVMLVDLVVYENKALKEFDDEDELSLGVAK